MKFNPVELIIKKKTGQELTQSELEYFVNSYINNEIPEYQMSALLMAIYFQNMKIEEIQTLTKVYIESGKQITFPTSLKTVDKHSTGGVGDKITIMLAPIVAACGGKIPMISGRGLGHTGGTLDKLESIPGFRTDFNDIEFKKIIEQVGFCIISQSEELVPADRRIYALRDVSGTVESLPLITASIMSKKIAEGAQNLVIDLKIGSGAFIKDLETGRELANLLIKTGEKFRQKVSVVFSNMNSPLGGYIGNALEIKETIEYLQGKEIRDIDILTRTLAIEMLLLSEKAETEEEAMSMVEEVIKNGKALECFRNSIAAQGGNPDVCNDLSLLPQAKYKIPIVSQKSGWIKSINSQQIGYALIEIGAGRKTLDSKLDYSSGAYLAKKIGDKIDENETIGHIFCNNKDEGNNIISKILDSYELIDEKVSKENIILELIK
ncbi:MAG: thymidine phosphorylase [Candidatus Cloacimonetes bacterium]|nr:thymidine phosphorylase [Candidatus Cloacimonadota bacterium]